VRPVRGLSSGFGYPLSRSSCPWQGRTRAKGDDSVAEIRESVRLHPTTVTQAENIVANSQKPRRRTEPAPVSRRYRKGAKRPSGVHEKVWEAAQRLTERGYQSIVILSDTEVLVINK